MAGLTRTKKAENLPPLTLGLLVGCTIIVAAFVLVVLYPQYRERESAYEMRLATALLLKEQEILFPHYTRATGMAKRSFEPLYEISRGKGLNREEIGALTKNLGEMAGRNKMKLSGNSLDIINLKKDETWLTTELSLGGTLFDFRNFLVALLQLPYLDQMEAVTVHSRNVMGKFKVKIWIRIEKSEAP